MMKLKSKLVFVKNYKPNFTIPLWKNNIKLSCNPQYIGSRGKIFTINKNKNTICKKIAINNYGYREIFGLQKTSIVNLSPKLQTIYKDDDYYYIFMNKEKINLLDFILNPYRKFTFKENLFITKLILGNISLLHNKCKLLHRDLKPSNLLISFKNKSDLNTENKIINNVTLKMIDFDCCQDLTSLYPDTLYPIGTKYYRYVKQPLPNFINYHINQDYFAIGIILCVLFTNGRIHESVFYENTSKQNKHFLYKEILENHFKELYNDTLDTDDILSLVDLLISLLDIYSNHNLNFFTIINSINLILDIKDDNN